MWLAYDRIISISDDVTKTFLKIFPTLSAKIVKIENIIPENISEDEVVEFIKKNQNDIKRNHADRTFRLLPLWTVRCCPVHLAAEVLD